MQSLEFTKQICAFLSSKKAEDILYVDVREKTVLCDYFVICSGRNTTQVKALCENLEEKFSIISHPNSWVSPYFTQRMYLSGCFYGTIIKIALDIRFISC